MELKLEPMTVGQILDKAFRLYSQNFLRFITIVAVALVPLFLVQLLIGKVTLDAALARTHGAGGASLAVLALLAGLVNLIGQAFCSGALVKGISGAYLDQPVSAGSAYRYVAPKVLSLIGASIMVGLLTVLGFVLLIVPGIIVMTMYALTTTAIVCEDMRAFKGMTRSEKLSKGNKGKIFTVLIAVGVLTAVVGWVLGWIGGFLQSSDASHVWSNVLVSSLFNLISQILVAPISSAAVILMYYDLRIRKEGFDLEMLAKSMNMAVPAGSAATAPAAPASPAPDSTAPPQA